MKETIFKVGDKVFDYQFGWGMVMEANGNDSHPIFVQFKGNDEMYTAEGEIFKGYGPTLSLTEYTLEGFSQERPSLADELIDRLNKSGTGVTRIDSIVIHKFFEEKGLFTIPIVVAS